MTTAQPYTEGWAVPGIDPEHALCILAPDATRDQFLAARRHGLGGSDLSVLLGMSKYRTPYELWAEKLDPTVAEPEREPMFWGRTLEGIVRDVFCDRTGLTVTHPGSLRSVRWPWMTCNLDGLCSDGAIYEGKTCRDYAAREWDDGQVADHAELQAQHNMAVTGAPGCHVACLIGGQELAIRYVERNDELIATIVEAERQFWEDHVLAEVEPPVDGSEAYKKTLERRFGIAGDGAVTIDEQTRDQLRKMLAQADAAASYAEVGDLAANQMRQLMGEHIALHALDEDGRIIELATWEQNGTFAEKRFRDAEPDQWAKYTTKVEKLDTKSLKEGDPQLYTRYRARTLRIKMKDND